VRRALFWRSFAIQGSWNYQTLIGTGFAFLLAPALRQTYGGDPAALRAAAARHAETFNSHPYLVTVAAGAVARLEAGGAPPELVQRFKTALRGSLGTLGDRLVWLVWRPMSGLLGCALLLAGASWWLAVTAFLVVYNALHLWMRLRGLQAGLRDGLQVGRALKELPFQALGERGADAGALLAGFCAVLAFGRGGASGWGWLVLPLVAGAGYALGFRLRRAAVAVLLAALAAGMVLARTS
jgi:PTS system mannose-specific IID component